MLHLIYILYIDIDININIINDPFLGQRQGNAHEYFFYYCCNNVNNWMPPPLPSFFGSLIYFPFHQMFFRFSCFVICPLLLFKILSLAHYDGLGFKCQNNKFFKYDTWVCFRLFFLWNCIEAHFEIHLNSGCFCDLLSSF